MFGVSACHLPDDSLLARFGGPSDYRDCFVREVAGEVTLEQYIERFYCSLAFRPERIVLGLMGRNASNEDARKLARGETDRFGVWEVIGRRSADRKGDRPPAGPEGRGDRSAGSEAEPPKAGQPLRETKTPLEAKSNRLDEILLESKGTGTASWLSTQPAGDKTKLLFGSWVGNLEQSGWRIMQRPHQYYSQALLGWC